MAALGVLRTGQMVEVGPGRNGRAVSGATASQTNEKFEEGRGA